MRTKIKKATTEDCHDKVLLKEKAIEAPIVKFLYLILEKAIKDNSYKLCFTPFKDQILIEEWVDGTPYEVLPPPKSIYSALVSKIKLMAGLDIQRGDNQKGVFGIYNKNGEGYVLSVSIIPKKYGENVVMNIREQSIPRRAYNLGSGLESLEFILKLK